MATIDTRTPRLNLPVPVVTNALKDDCPRLVEALTTLDGAVAGNIDNLREQWRRQLADAGLTLVDGSFEEGATVTKATDAVWHIAGGQCYTWGGDLPKTVASDSTPDATGGIGLGAWVSVGDATAISRLASTDDGEGDSLIGVKQPYANTVARTQHDKNAETISILDFAIEGQADWTQAFKNAARVSADAGKIILVPAGDYVVSDSIPLYDDGYGTVSAPDVQSYYKGNGTKFVGEGRKTVIIKTSTSTKDVNAVFYIDSTNAVPAENGKRGMEISHMSIVDLTEGSVGIYNNNGVVCSHFEDLFIMARRVGVWVGGAFVDVTFHGVIVQGHDDTVTYPLDYGFRVGAGNGTSISMDRCHVGSVIYDGYELRSQYSKIGVISCDNAGGVAYVFKEFRGHIQSLGGEWTGTWTGNPNQNGTFMSATSSQISIGLCSMLGKYSNSYLFQLTDSRLKIDQVDATDSCVFIGSPARLRTSSLLDIGYFTQYKYEQFPNPIDYDGTTRCFATVGDLGGTQYRLREGDAVYGMFKMPTAQPTGECYRIMGTKSVANMSGCVGTITAVRGSTSISRAALMMDVVCNGNGNIGTSAIAVKRAVSDPVGLSSYTGWYEGTVDGVLYMMLKMDTLGDRNLGTFFTGTTIGRDPHLFRVVTPDQITGLVASSIGVMKTETSS